MMRERERERERERGMIPRLVRTSIVVTVVLVMLLVGEICNTNFTAVVSKVHFHIKMRFLIKQRGQYMQAVYAGSVCRQYMQAMYAGSVGRQCMQTVLCWTVGKHG